MLSTGNGRSRLLALLTHQLDKVELTAEEAIPLETFLEAGTSCPSRHRLPVSQATCDVHTPV